MERNDLDLNTEVKISRWPRTSRRQERVEQILRQRQVDLTVILEDVHDRHNVSAALRSCDAVGVLDVHLIYVLDEPPRKAFARTSSGSAAKWMRIHRHDSIEGCFRVIRESGKKIFVTALTEDAVDLHDVDMTQPIALLFGNEHRGASADAVAQADGSLYIPMMGMVESLNISVACAVTLYEAQRQLAAAGRYSSPQLSEAEIAATLGDWLEK
ncbi:MAG: RNA methyltransferase [Thermomicrobiales bacterium]